MNLTQARDRIKFYLSDENGKKYTDNTIDFALSGTLQMVVATYVAKSGPDLIQTVELTASNGQLDLSAYNPLKIYSVSKKYSNHYNEVKRIRNGTPYVAENGTHTLKITMVQKPSMPSSATGSFDYGVSGYSNAILDNLVVLHAVTQLSTADDEIHKVSELIPFYWNSVLSLGDKTSAVDLPRGGEQYSMDNAYFYVLEGNIIKMTV